MYRNKKFNRNARTPSTENVLKRPLKTIDENTTIKLQRREESQSNGATEKQSIFADEEDLLGEPQSSEENIPASQEPSQRYLSQRSNFASTLGRTQSWNSTNRPPNTYFELSLTKAGVQLNEGDTFILSCDHVAFVERFREILKGNQNYPDNIETFKTGLEQALDPKSKMALKLLSGCTISAAGEDSVYQSQDSMIVNFLMIDFLSEHVLDVLLNKIEKAACDSVADTRQGTVPLLPLMLAQLRYVVLSHGQIIYERIKNIFEKATDNGRLGIIANAELVLDASKHDEFTQMLLDNLESSQDFFNPTTITALTNLFLSAEMQIKLRTKIRHYILDSNHCPNNLLPSLIKFMLKILSEDNETYICELIETLRIILLHKANKPLEKQTQIEIFGYIEQGLIRSRKFYINWQKAIIQIPERRFASIDFVVLLMLVYIKEENSLYVENILRRKIKNENLSLTVLHAAKNSFPVILEKYTSVLMGVLNDFLKEKTIAISNFARSSYEILFHICESVQKSILKKLLQFTSDKSAQNMSIIALELLKNLHQKHPKEIQNWGMLLMPLLDRLNEMTLSQTRLVMQLLCSIAYPSPTLAECPALQDQINMLVKKQMINRNSSVKKQGILGCAQLIVCMARAEDISLDTEGLDISYQSISQIPDGRGRIAAQLFERVKSATINCPESLGLFYDELASVLIASKNEKEQNGILNKPFLFWLNDTVRNDFQNNFTASEVSSPMSGIPLTALKSINKADEIPEQNSSEFEELCLKISNLVLNPANESTNSILVMSSTFNLLRVLCVLSSEGSLEPLNATLGCSIILPTFFDDDDFEERIRNEFDIEAQKKILDIYFHCANWFREIISSFITQIDDMSRMKSLKRLNELVKIESRIRKLLTWTPNDYMPPKCQFLTEVTQNTNKTERGKPAVQTKNQAKSKDNKNLTENNDMTLLNETEANNTMKIDRTLRTVGGHSSSKQKTEKLEFDNLYGPKEIYRQMEANIVLFLREKLNITMPFPAERIGMDIGLPEYQFILADLVQKLESILGVQKLHTEENLQYIAKPCLFINDLSTQLTHINKNMKMIANAINIELTKVNNIYGNVDLFTENFCYLRSCFNLSVRLLAAFFSWPVFAEDSQSDLLKASLTKLYAAMESSCKNRTNNFEVLIIDLFHDFWKYESSILDIKTAVHLHNLLTTLRKLAGLNGVCSTVLSKQANEIRSLCKTFLQRKWYNYAGHMEKGARCNVCLDVLVKGFLKNCDFKRQHSIIDIVLQEVKLLNKKDNVMKSFPNLYKANFPILYRGLCETLISSINDLTTQGGSYAGDKIRLWEESCNLLNELLKILKEIEAPRNFQCFVKLYKLFSKLTYFLCLLLAIYSNIGIFNEKNPWETEWIGLKYAHVYIKLVLQHGLSHMEECLRENSERILYFLKNLQTSTRFLHNLCCQTKSQIANTTIVNQIPFLRQTMEVFVFRVKAMLLANKCDSAWNVGLLRNKDTRGEIILSQSVTSVSAAEESEEEIPEDDTTVCESLLEPNEPTSSSNIYANVYDKNGTVSKLSSRSNCI